MCVCVCVCVCACAFECVCVRAFAFECSCMRACVPGCVYAALCARRTACVRRTVRALTVRVHAALCVRAARCVRACVRAAHGARVDADPDVDGLVVLRTRADKRLNQLQSADKAGRYGAARPLQTGPCATCVRNCFITRSMSIAMLTQSIACVPCGLFSPPHATYT
jgi:hypothetical protein